MYLSILLAIAERSVWIKYTRVISMDFLTWSEISHFCYKTSKCDPEMPQSKIIDQPMAPCGRGTHTHTRTHTRAHTLTHTQARAHTLTRTHTHTHTHTRKNTIQVKNLSEMIVKGSKINEYDQENHNHRQQAHPRQREEEHRPITGVCMRGGVGVGRGLNTIYWPFFALKWTQGTIKQYKHKKLITYP